MKLDASMIRFLTREEFRTLTAIEQGMKNHELVPTSLIVNIGKISFIKNSKLDYSVFLL